MGRVDLELKANISDVALTGNGFVAHLLFRLNIFWNTDKASVSRPACGGKTYSEMPPNMTNMQLITEN